jgi:Heparinase II/III-like protein/Heparinase II/III N-terminus
MAMQSRWARRIARLKSMSWHELVDRVRQHVSVRIDAYRFRRGHDFTREWSRECARRTGRFFFAAFEVQGLCELLKQRFPSATAGIVAGAERICRHRFDLLGYEDLDYGAEIDWHLDLVHSKRGPRKPWFKVRYLDFEEVGDAKITWELNRHQHLVTLAKAYRLTGDEKFAREIAAQWKHWQIENPYPIGMNWASSLEVAFRSLSWIWVYFLLEDTPEMTADLRRDWMRALGLCGRHIETYISTYFSPNTHLLGEGVALFFLGALFPELPRAHRWKQRGWDVVLEAARRQVRADGLHFEQSTYYHVYALDFFLHARVLAALNNVEIPPEYDTTIIKMLEALCLLGRAGIAPSLGDDDGGRLFDPGRNRGEHLLDPLTTAAVLFQRGDFKFLAGAPREETLWLLGTRGLAELEELKSAEPTSGSLALKEGGLYLMADAESGRQLLIDAGPQGSETAGHGHADALSLCLASNGRMLLMDPGTLEYVGENGKDRDLFRGTGAHNTMRVDGLDQANASGPFAWSNVPAVKAERWITGRDFNLFVGSHDGYERLPAPVTHRRWVFHRKAQFWLVRDEAIGQGEHSLELTWHLGANLSPTSARDYLFGDREESFGLLTADGHGWSQSAHRGPWSPAYGRQERTTVVTFGRTSTLPAEFVTLLLPNTTLHDGMGKLERLASDPAVRSYRYTKPGQEHYFLFSNDERPWTFGAWASDAQFLYWAVNREIEQRTLILCHGTYVEVSGLRVLTSEVRVDYAEAVGSPTKAGLFSSDPDHMHLQGSLDRMDAELTNDPKRIGV